MPEFSNLRVVRNGGARLIISKENESFDVNQLSTGEKNLIALVGDIARRLILANPLSTNPLNEEGIILIDEIDLHLHPNWQRMMVPQLRKTFPNCQFMITTHSPQVVSEVKSESLFILNQNENGLEFNIVDESYGMSTDRVVELIMGGESRPKDVLEKIDTVFEYIERNKLVQAKELINLLKLDLKTDPEIMRAEMLIRKAELKNEIH